MNSSSVLFIGPDRVFPTFSGACPARLATLSFAHTFNTAVKTHRQMDFLAIFIYWDAATPKRIEKFATFVRTTKFRGKIFAVIQDNTLRPTVNGYTDDIIALRSLRRRLLAILKQH